MLLTHHNYCQDFFLFYLSLSLSLYLRMNSANKVSGFWVISDVNLELYEIPLSGLYQQTYH